MKYVFGMSLWLLALVGVNMALAERDTRMFEATCERYSIYCESE